MITRKPVRYGSVFPWHVYKIPLLNYFRFLFTISMSICYHCNQVGHQRNQCLERYFELSMATAFHEIERAGTYSQKTIDAFRSNVRRVLEKAIAEGKRGNERRFGGHPTS